MPRRFALTLLVVSALALIVPGAAFADTQPGTTPVDVWVVSTSFSFDSGGHHWSGIGQIEDERISGNRSVSFQFNGSGATKLCDADTPGDPSDDYIGAQYIEFFSTSASIKTLSVATDLSQGGFDVALTGREVTLDACTGELLRSRAVKHRFKTQVAATAPANTETDVFLVDNGDGTFSRVTQTASFAPALGTATLDNQPLAVDDANLQHAVIQVEPA